MNVVKILEEFLNNSWVIYLFLEDFRWLHPIIWKKDLSIRKIRQIGIIKKYPEVTMNVLEIL